MVDAVTVEDIDVWDADLSALTGGLGWLFVRPEPRGTFGLIVGAMLAEVGKKNCWGMSEHAGLPNPKRFQHLLNAASWDAGALRDWLRGYVLAGLADAEGALVLDDTQVIKKGRESVGVGPQRCGETGADGELPVRGDADLCQPARARVHRPGDLPTGVVDG
jgi:hypothetical protein